MEHVFPFQVLSIRANIRGMYPLKWYVSTYRPPFDAIQREFENSKGQTEGNRVPARVVRLIRRFSMVTSIFEYSFYSGIKLILL